MTRQLCIAVHDVAPETWPQCERLLALLDAFGRLPVTLLVVPNYHGHGAVAASPAVVRRISELAGGGCEVALHGYYHRDDSPPPQTPNEWLRRRVLTAREGEFSSLQPSEAARRIRRGWKELNDLFRPVRGFVAPAWLSNESTWTTLRASPLRYATTRHALVALDDMRQLRAPVVTVSARSRWRRAASRVWLRALCRATASAPLLRVALHPVDAQYPDVIEDWHRALRILLDQRTAVTKSQALGIV